jgi:hypothetical protein
MPATSTSYTNVFTGQLLQPSQAAYNPIVLTGNLLLQWPLETAPNANLATPIIDIGVASTGSFNVTLPPANQVGNGTFLIVNNLSSFNQAVLNNAGSVIVASQAPGSVFFYYLQSNTTAAGVWFAFQYGAAISAPSVAAAAGPGLRAVGATLGQDIVVKSISSNYTLSLATPGDQTMLINWIGGTGTITVPLAVAAGANWYVQIRNSGTSILTLMNSGSDTINGVSGLSMNPGDSLFLVTDGTTWWTIGLGPVSSGAFHVITINLTGDSGNYVLTGSQLNQIGYTFTGALAGNVTIIVPNTTQEYWCRNTTTGGFTLSIGTAAQVSPPTIPNGGQAIYYCDGANVYLATPGSAISSLPVQIGQGGTNATTAAQALINLGGSSTGIGIFTATTPAAAQATIGSPSTADAVVFAMIL